MKIAFIADNFKFGSPAQQLRDRFRIGFPRDGVFQKSAHEITDNLEGSDAAIVIKPGATIEILKVAAKRQIPVYVYGTVPPQGFEIDVPYFCATELATALQLPAIKPTRVREALIIVHGENPELTALNGLLPLLKNPKPVEFVRHLKDLPVWAAAARNEWSRRLLRAALSRSDSPQGNALLDGRVEDMTLQVQSLAKSPRAILLQHADKSQSTILILDGVISDIVVALDSGGKIQSTQLFRAPSPMREDFSRLAIAIEDFFITKRSPWPNERFKIFSKAFDQISIPRT